MRILRLFRGIIRESAGSEMRADGDVRAVGGEMQRSRNFAELLKHLGIGDQVLRRVLVWSDSSVFYVLFKIERWSIGQR